MKNKIEYENCLLINQSAQNKVSNLLVIFVDSRKLIIILKTKLAFGLILILLSLAPQTFEPLIRIFYQF